MQHSFCSPVDGDRILVLRERWLGLILQGHKVVEIRGRPLRRGTYFLGCKSKIYGSCVVGDVAPVTSAADWRALLPRHLVDTPEPPYRRTFAHSLLRVARATATIPYRHPRGAVGIVRFHPS